MTLITSFILIYWIWLHRRFLCCIFLSRDARSVTGKWLPCAVESVSGDYNVADLWRQYDFALFNCIKSEPYEVGNVASRDSVIVTPHEVQQAVALSSDNKAYGSENITVYARCTDLLCANSENNLVFMLVDPNLSVVHLPMWRHWYRVFYIFFCYMVFFVLLF